MTDDAPLPLRPVRPQHHRRFQIQRRIDSGLDAGKVELVAESRDGGRIAGAVENGGGIASEGAGVAVVDHVEAGGAQLFRHAPRETRDPGSVKNLDADRLTRAGIGRKYDCLATFEVVTPEA